MRIIALAGAGLVVLVATVVVLVTVGGGDDAAAPVTTTSTPSTTVPLPKPPALPTGPLPGDVDAALGRIAADGVGASLTDYDVVAAGGDLRAVWSLLPLARVAIDLPAEQLVSNTVARLSGLDLATARAAVGATDTDAPWVVWTDLLLRWDVPAPDRHVADSAAHYGLVDPAFVPLVVEGDLDWREVTWGGVEVDGIPTLVDPPVESATGAWPDDDEPVLGVVVEGEARAYPRRHLDLHEVAEDTVGGRRILVTLCTLCGSAVAFDLDDLDVPAGAATPVLRTSGLLESSNKLVVDLASGSLFRQFTGEALTGPWADAEADLPIVGVAVTTWGEWRAEHPDTTVVVEDAGTGRNYAPAPTAARDADGPVFPVGEIDDRLPPVSEVFGVVGPEGPVAFDVEALRSEGAASAGGVSVRWTDGGVVLDEPDGGVGVVTRWFAWADRHPGTAVWDGR